MYLLNAETCLGLDTVIYCENCTGKKKAGKSELEKP